ncbi:MAG: DMT family transporter [Alphaproteobacteria bacterium]|nr:DMT family transporter [Alphaproteobacteria bacterium]
MTMTHNTKGVIFMMVSMFGFVVNDTLMKSLFITYPIIEIIFLRALFCLPLLFIAMKIKRVKILNHSRLTWNLMMLRGFAEVMATITFLYALKHLPLPNVTAIIQILPLSVTMAAALFLNERVGYRRWTAIIIGLIGVIIVINPGAEGFSSYSYYAVLSVIFVTMREMVTRKLPPEVPSVLVTFVTIIGVTIMSAVAMPFVSLKALDASTVILVFSASIAVFVGYLFSIMAMRVGEISLVSQFRYTGMIWATLLGYVMFSDIPTPNTIFGVFIIVASGLYAFHRKRIKEAKL